jgi:hypothetical protein
MKTAEQMKRNYAISLLLVLALSPIGLCSATPTWTGPWLGVHVMLTTRNKTEQPTQVVKDLAEMGVNSIVAEINYGYEYESHPELRSGNPSSKESVKRLAFSSAPYMIFADPVSATGPGGYRSGLFNNLPDIRTSQQRASTT